MENHIYTKQSSRFAFPQFQMLGVLLFIIGMVLAYQLNLWSILVLVGGFALATVTTGVQVDFKRKMHRDYIRILGYKYGKWVIIHTLDYVTVFVESYYQNMGAASIHASDNFSDFKINLVVSETQHFDAGGFSDKTKAFENAKKIAGKFGVKLLDFTSKESRWVDI